MRKFFKKVHTWLSIPVGLIIVVVCFTGCLLVFDTEILEMYYPERYFVNEVKADKIPLDKLIPLINEQLTDNEVASVKVSSDPKRTYTMMLKEGFRISAFADPYTGKVTGIYEFKEGFFYKVMALHRWLMDGSRTFGKYTVGISTLMMAFILISGLFIWVPKAGKKWKSRLVIKTTAGRKRLYHDLHIVLGMYACIFLLVCSLTGLMWSFDWYRNTVFAIFGEKEKKEEKNDKHDRGDEKGKGNSTIQWDAVLANVRAIEPDFQTITIQKGGASVFPASAAHFRVSNKYAFDAETGAITKTTLYADTPVNARVFAWAYALHVGDYWGVWSKILTCLASLVGTSLPLTGYYMYFFKRNKKNKKKQKEKLAT